MRFYKIWLGEGVPDPHHDAKFHRCGFKMWVYSPQNRKKFVIFNINLLLRKNSKGRQKKLDIGAQLQTSLYVMTP